MRPQAVVLAVLLIAGCSSPAPAPSSAPAPQRFAWVGQGDGSQAALERDGARCRYEIAQIRQQPSVGYVGGRVVTAAPVPRDEDGIFLDCMRARGWTPD